jgi:hypothetical protein
VKLDWQHVTLAVVGLGCATACILLGHGSVLLQVLGGLGGATTVVSLVKGSPIQPATIAPTTFADEEPTRKEGRSLPPEGP